MYLDTKNTKETLTQIENTSSILWHSGHKPTDYVSKAAYLIIDTNDVAWGLMHSTSSHQYWGSVSHKRVDAETFIKKCAELAPKEGEK